MAYFVDGANQMFELSEIYVYFFHSIFEMVCLTYFGYVGKHGIIGDFEFFFSLHGQRPILTEGFH